MLLKQCEPRNNQVTMKKILLLVHAVQTRPGHLNWVAFRDLLRHQLGSEIQVEMSALTELTFLIANDNARIYDPLQDYDVRDFDLIVFRTIGRQLEPAISVAAYCRKYSVPYIDPYIPSLGNTKLSCAFVRFEHGLRIPNLAYGTTKDLIDLAQQGTLGWPLIVKADAGKKGRDNYLVHSLAELQVKLTEHSNVKFVIQSFIPNDGDYRMLILNGKPVMAILRKGAKGNHLNNTSQGGSAENVDPSAIPQQILELAEKATELEQLAAAGVDIIIDKTTGIPYILEVNRAPQLATGAFPEEKITRYVAALKEILAKGGIA